MWHQSVNWNFMKPREYFLRKENKNKDFIPHFPLYCFSCGRAFTTVHDASAWWRKRLSVEHTAWWRWTQGMCSTSSRWIWISACATTRLRHVLSLFLFTLRKKYSRGFIKLQLTDWCHMDYFVDHLGTFLDLDRVRTLAVYGRVRELSDSNKNILICVPKMNGGFTGLERHQGE